MATPSFAFLDIRAQTKNLPTSHNFYPTSPQSWWLCLQNRSRIWPLLPILPTAAQVPHLTTIYFAQSNQVMLSKHVRSHYSSAQNPPCVPCLVFKTLKMAYVIWLSPPSVASQPLSSHAPFQPHPSPCFLRTCQAHTCFGVFAQTIPSQWKLFPERLT